MSGQGEQDAVEAAVNDAVNAIVALPRQSTHVAVAHAVIQVLVDGGHYVPKETRAYTMALQAERDAARARAEAADAALRKQNRNWQDMAEAELLADTRLAEAVDLLRRCESVDGVYRCQGDAGHAGAHWADVGRSPAVLRWGMRGYGCFDPECVRAPGHPTPHRNGRGRSWWPIERDSIDWCADDA